MIPTVLPRGWTAADQIPGESRARLMDEMAVEIGRGHILFDRAATLLAVGPDDDILVSLDDAPPSVAVVHLTWRRNIESPPWPATSVFRDGRDFLRHEEA